MLFDAVNHEDGECTCPALLIPVNLDDDDGDGVEDRNDNLSSQSSQSFNSPC